MTHRELSVHVEHELLLKLETAGLTQEMAQRIIQSQGNRLAQELVDFLMSRRLGWVEAKKLVGVKNFFGPLEWEKFFGPKANLLTFPEIPWNKSELEKPGINQEHFLFLGLNLLDGKPLDLPAWHKLYPGGKHPKFCRDWYLSDKFAQGTCELGWYLMPVGIVKGSQGLSFDRQVGLLPDEYEVPSAPERVTANILYGLLNKEYLDPYFLSTSSKSCAGGRVRIRGYSGDGLDIDVISNDTAVGFGGVSASRKF
jgi:hypothetical protein